MRGEEMHLNGRTQAAFVGYRGRERSSFFFRRGKTTEYIRKGSVFRRLHADRTVESARVLAVAIDGFGIPHVRYEIKFVRPYQTNNFFEGPRMLALSAFIATYSERMSA